MDPASPHWSLYLVAVIGILVIHVLTCVIVRVLAKVSVYVVFLGGIGLMCYAIHAGEVATWDRFLYAVLLIGAGTAWYSMTAELYMERPEPARPADPAELAAITKKAMAIMEADRGKGKS